MLVARLTRTPGACTARPSTAKSRPVYVGPATYGSCNSTSHLPVSASIAELVREAGSSMMTCRKSRCHQSTALAAACMLN
jgi:hypothetical protein